MIAWLVGKNRIKPQPSKAQHATAGGSERAIARHSKEEDARPTPAARNQRRRILELNEATNNEAKPAPPPMAPSIQA